MPGKVRGILLAAVTGFLCGCHQTDAPIAMPFTIQSHLNHHCAEAGKALLNKENLDGIEKPTTVEAFYSLKINTCVQVEIIDGPSWSYTLRDVTNDFFHDDEWLKAEIPLEVFDFEPMDSVHAEGFWQSTDPDKDRQLVGQIAAEIDCTRGEAVCRETDAQVFMGILQPGSHEYAISTWTPAGIVADDTDEGSCAIGHRLTIDFKSNSVVVTDYPKKVGGAGVGGLVDCSAFQSAYSYALHGGNLQSPGTFKPDIFYCDKDGAGSALVSQVEKFGGNVGDKSYHLWQDDGNGGLPRTEKIPDHPYTRQECEQLLGKKLKEL